jgi:hypothetical protein
MKIETKYSIGDKVWYVSEDMLSKSIGCTVCKDTKEITIEGLNFQCPNCVTRHNNSRWCRRAYISGSSRIGSVRYEITAEDYNKQTKIEIRYMLYDTGVGSGSLWDEAKLFSSKSEAQAWCDNQNEEFAKSDL